MKKRNNVKSMINVVIALLILTILFRIHLAYQFLQTSGAPFSILILFSILIPAALIYFVYKQNTRALLLVTLLTILGLTKTQWDFSNTVSIIISISFILMNIVQIVLPLVIVAKLTNFKPLKDTERISSNKSEYYKAVKLLYLVGLTLSLIVFVIFSIALLPVEGYKPMLLLYFAMYLAIIPITIMAIKKEMVSVLTVFSALVFIMSIILVPEHKVMDETIQLLVTILYFVFGGIPLVFAFVFGLLTPYVAILLKIKKKKN